MDTIQNILNLAKTFFGLSEEATNAELHEAMLASSPSKKDDAIIDMASEIASLVKSETEKQVSEFTAKLESDYKSIIETMESKVSDLESKLAETKPEATKPEATEDFTTKFNEINSAIENLKFEFGIQLNEIKSAPKAAAILGDGTVISKHETKVDPLPAQGRNFIKL